MIITKNAQKEDGFILITCLVMLVVLTVIGIIASRTSRIEVRTAANSKDAKTVFYMADSGLYTAPKVIRRTLISDSTDMSTVSVGSMNFTDPTTNLAETPQEFRRKIFGFNPDETNINFPFANGGISVNIQRTGTEPLVGGAQEFASGHEGAGHNLAVAVLYTLNSNSQTANNANSSLEALYRFVPETAGGL